jgi:hypothetical protein
LISKSSIKILPSNISTILGKERQIVLLPEPVLPTIPIFSFGLISNERFLRTTSVVGLYFRDTFSKIIFPY